MASSRKRYICSSCHQTVNAMGWGSHRNGYTCTYWTSIYEQGFADAKAAMFGKLNQVKP